MHIQFFVEEPSSEAALNQLLPRMLPQDVSFDIQVFQGKTDLLRQLPLRLRALAVWIPEDWRVVVLVDRDDDNCQDLKHRLDEIAAESGLRIRHRRQVDQSIQILNRIAIEELEAWFFGDIPALRQAYPRISQHLSRRDRYRHPDESKAQPGRHWSASYSGQAIFVVACKRLRLRARLRDI